MTAYALAIVEPRMVSLPWAPNPISSYHTCFVLSVFELPALPCITNATQIQASRLRRVTTEGPHTFLPHEESDLVSFLTFVFNCTKQDGKRKIVYHSRMKETMAQDFVLPGLCSPSKQRHLVRPMTITWAMARNTKAATAYDDETSESYLQ